MIIKGKFKNKCEGGWKFDFTDEDVEYFRPEENRNNKEQLKKWWFGERLNLELHMMWLDVLLE